MTSTECACILQLHLTVTRIHAIQDAQKELMGVLGGELAISRAGQCLLAAAIGLGWIMCRLHVHCYG